MAVAGWALSRAGFGALLLTLIFAAKEALYKALYPDCRQIMEFSAARVVTTATQMLLQLTQVWSAAWCAGTEIWLDYQTDIYGVQVLTEVSSRTAMPCSPV